MVGKLGKFRVEYGVHGASIHAVSNKLTPSCLSEGEIAECVDALKADLDACAREMNRRAKSEYEKFMRGGRE